MNLIEKIGGIGPAEMIASCLLTTAVDPQYFCLEPKQYFNVVDGVVYFYNDDHAEFFPWGDFENCGFEYVSIADLRTEIVDRINKEFEKLYVMNAPKWALERDTDGSYKYHATQSAFVLFQHQQAELDKLQKRINKALPFLDRAYKFTKSTSCRLAISDAKEVLWGESEK